MAVTIHDSDRMSRGRRSRSGLVLMPGSIELSGTEREGSVPESHQRPNGITLAEMQRSARHVLRLLVTLPR